MKEQKTRKGRSARIVDEYIAAAPKAVQPMLRQVRRAIKEAAPGAVEGFSYGIPFYDYRGWLAWFSFRKGYIGFYLRPPVIAEHKKELAGYVTTKSAIHLPLDRTIPVALVKRLVRARVKKNEAEGKVASAR